MEGASLERKRQVELKGEYDRYLQSHPEIQTILNDFISECLVHQPRDVAGFARDYFLGTAQAPPPKSSS